MIERADLKARIAERYQALSSTKWPTGAAQVPEIGDSDVDLAELEGFVAGLASSYLQNARLRYDRIRLSRRLAATFSGTPPVGEQDRLEPWRRQWRMVLELAELLALTGKVRIEWED